MSDSILQDLMNLELAYYREIAQARHEGCPDDAPCMAPLLEASKQLRAEIAKLEKQAMALLNKYAF